MTANNETGAVYDVKSAFRLAHSVSKDIICHTDAIQAFQKTEFTVSSIGADMVSVSGHKVHSPKGVGALWINSDIVRRSRIDPLIYGGGQEDGLRSGTENLPQIAAFAAAVSDNGGNSAGAIFEERTTALRSLLINNLPENVTENKPEGKSLPHIISLTLPIPRSQPILNHLSAKGIYISAGSACSSHRDTVSKSLLSFGLSREAAASTVRVSLDITNTEEEIMIFCNELKIALSMLYGKKKQADT